MKCQVLTNILKKIWEELLAVLLCLHCAIKIIIAPRIYYYNWWVDACLIYRPQNNPMEM